MRVYWSPWQSTIYPGSMDWGRGRGLGAVSPGMDTVAQAIQRQEGYYPGSPSYRNNNPGNLIASSWTQRQPGYVGADPNGFAIFDTLDNGMMAEQTLISNYAARGYTVAQMMAAWAPGSQAGNNPTVYAQNVAQAAGVGIDTPVADVLSGGSGQAPGDVVIADATGPVPLPDFPTPADTVQSTMDPGTLGLLIAGGVILLTQL